MPGWLSRIFLLLTIVVVSSGSTCFGGTNEQIIAALRKNNTELISKYFDGNIDAKILDKENIYSKAQATVLVKLFLDEHQIQSVTINQQGGLKEKQFAICELKTNTGTFRLYFLTKQKDGKHLIQKFRIERK